MLTAPRPGRTAISGRNRQHVAAARKLLAEAETKLKQLRGK